MQARFVSFAFTLVAACGGGNPPAGVDSKPPGDMSTIDAPPATVMMVACAGGEPVIETTGGFRFMPMTLTIAVNDVVNFTNASVHSLAPGAAPTDPGLRTGFGGSTCLRFTAAGTFNFRCNPHTTMTGTITVQ